MSQTKILNVPKVRELMSLEELNQKEMASKLNVSNSTVSDWLNGKIKPSKVHIEKLADILDTNAEELLMDTPQFLLGSHSTVFYNSYQYFINEGATVHIYHNHNLSGKEDEDKETPFTSE